MVVRARTHATVCRFQTVFDTVVCEGEITGEACATCAALATTRRPLHHSPDLSGWRRQMVTRLSVFIKHITNSLDISFYMRE